jgi:hypothetical protein
MEICDCTCLIYVVCHCLRIVVSNSYCVVLLLCVTSCCVFFVCHPMLPFLIGPSVFSNVYLPVSLDCPFLIALRYSLTFICQFL